MHIRHPSEFLERRRIACLGALPQTAVEAGTTDGSLDRLRRPYLASNRRCRYGTRAVALRLRFSVAFSSNGCRTR